MFEGCFCSSASCRTVVVVLGGDAAADLQEVITGGGSIRLAANTSFSSHFSFYFSTFLLLHLFVLSLSLSLSLPLPPPLTAAGR